ncbi:MAG: dihydropteroate synthase [Chitinophagaceae bacterium]
MFTLNCNGRLLVIDKPLIMGIINITPDSFYKASRQRSVDAILNRAEKMIRDGAAILDLGGQSTRPGSSIVHADEELKRVLPGIEAINKNFPEIFISVDTYYAAVALEAVKAGAALINDVSAGKMDKNMIPVVASLHVPYVLMHMQGKPQDMQQSPNYQDVTKEVLDFFITGIGELQRSGIRDIIIDPGFGFGKTIAHNFELLRNLPVFKITQKPLLLGISRKSTIYKTLNTTADDALNGTTVLNTIGLLNGASIIRVHDVKEAKEAIKLVSTYLQ